MGQRSATALPNSISTKTWDDFINCEVRHDAHEVHPRSWPPKRLGNTPGEPSVNLRCVRCNTNCIVYAGHATGEMNGVEVVLPKPKVESLKK